MVTSSKYLILIIGLSLLLFSSALRGFFSADDWFHLRVSQISTWQEFFNFFSLTPTPQSIFFYRPISTQGFFWLFQTLFGLNPLPFFIGLLTIFSLNLYLIYRLVFKIFNNTKVALMTVFFYGFSVTNFVKLYFISAGCQELLLVTFIILAVLNYLDKHKFKSLCFFILALLSKETAVILPALLLGVEFLKIPKAIPTKTASLRFPLTKSITGILDNLSALCLRLWPFLSISAVYLIMRLIIYPPSPGQNYDWNFHPLTVANTFFWYTLWAIGAPELLVDYVGSGLRVLPRFYTDFPMWSSVILGGLGTTAVVGISLAITQVLSVIRGTTPHHVRMARGFLLGIFWFVVSLLPVLFFPWHKFTNQLTLPMVGFAVGLAWLVKNTSSTSFLRDRGIRILSLLFFISWLFLNLSMNVLTYTRHYSVSRSRISKDTLSYLKSHYSGYPQGYYFEFINDTRDYGDDWGSSKQISHAISGSDLFRVYFRNHALQVYYEDNPQDPRPADLLKIPISTALFLK